MSSADRRTCSILVSSYDAPLIVSQEQRILSFHHSKLTYSTDGSPSECIYAQHSQEQGRPR